MISHITDPKTKVCALKFYKFARNQNPPTIICNQATLYRNVKVFKSSGALINIGDDGITVEFPKLIRDNQIISLKKSLSTVRYAEGVVGLEIAMLNGMQTRQDERNLLQYAKAPCRSTLQLYQAKSTLMDNGFSLVKTKYTMNKISRRQMAST